MNFLYKYITTNELKIVFNVARDEKKNTDPWIVDIVIVSLILFCTLDNETSRGSVHEQR
jgi:hypothetical protein